MKIVAQSTCSSCCSDEVLLEENVDQSLIIKTVISAFFSLPLLLHMFSDLALLHDPLFQLCMATPAVIIGLNHFGKSAYNSLKAKSANMDVLIVIGFTSAYIYSIWGMAIGRAHEFLFFETAASIVTYVLIGNVIEHRATKNTSSAIREFLELAPQTAKRVDPTNNKVEEIQASAIRVNDTLLAATGDKIAADGVVLKSDGLINESMITGESLPIEKSTSEQVFAGTIVEKGSVTYQVTVAGEGTVFSEILKTIQDAKNAKPNIQRIGDRVSAIFVPSVLIISIITFVGSFFIFDATLTESWLRAIAVLVIACPCAMGLATPTAVMVGVGRAAQSGILVKGGDIFERFSEIKKVIFDKTGTITEGDFAIQEVKILDSSYSKEEILSIIKSMESYSNHPLAKSLVRELYSFPIAKLSDITEETGLGLKAKLADGKLARFGSFKIFDSGAIQGGQNSLASYDLFLTISDKPTAALKISDKIRAAAGEVIDYLHSQNIQTALVSGDTDRKCKDVASRLKISTVFSQQTPSEKLSIIKEEQSKNLIAFVGDGVNDVPSISAASVGVSFAKASGSAIASAGIVILSNELSKVAEALKLSRATTRVIKQNLFWAFFYNILMIPLAMYGAISPSMAALVMALSDVFVIGNSLRLKILKLT